MVADDNKYPGGNIFSTPPSCYEEALTRSSVRVFVRTNSLVRNNRSCEICGIWMEVKIELCHKLVRS